MSKKDKRKLLRIATEAMVAKGSILPHRTDDAARVMKGLSDLVHVQAVHLTECTVCLDRRAGFSQRLICEDMAQIMIRLTELNGRAVSMIHEAHMAAGGCTCHG